MEKVETVKKNKKTEKYKITGMSCAACQTRIEKAISAVPGVEKCAVSLLTEEMSVEGTAKSQDIICAVKGTGYGAEISADETITNYETLTLKKRLIVSLCFLMVMMYFTMMHRMWNLYIPPFFQNPINLGIFEMIISGIILFINRKFFISGLKSLIHGAPNMDTLVMLGTAAAFGYSVAELFVMGTRVGTDSELLKKYSMNLYFESAAMIPTIITVGKMLEAMAKGRATDALKGLMKLKPYKATVLRNGEKFEIKAEEVKIDDIYIVRPGEEIPVDGIIIEGDTSINESSLTGESIPADKKAGDKVFAATINTTGYITCRATNAGYDTALSQIIKMVRNAATTKAPIARMADKVSGIFVPIVIGIAIITFAGWMFIGKDISFALERGVSVLVISCPCALGLATPVAIIVGNGIGAKNGILYKTSEALEIAGQVRTVILDKTGTITNGKPEVTGVFPEECTENELLYIANALEEKSEHPLAKAVTEYAVKKGINSIDAKDLKVITGRGLMAKIKSKFKMNFIYGGNYEYIYSMLDERNKEQYFESYKKNDLKKLSSEGKTIISFVKEVENERKYIGSIAVADSVKKDSFEAVSQLHNMGIRVVMLTGDNMPCAKAIGRISGVDEVIADVMPDEKGKIVQQLKKSGKTIMVGDGINDAPALTVADLGMAIGAGTDIAIDAAGVVLMKSSLIDAVAAIRLGRYVIKNIHENLFWAFCYNIICIPLAIGLFGVNMNPMYGAAAMGLSSSFVCMNALRLNFMNIYSTKHDHKKNKSINKVTINREIENIDKNRINQGEKMIISTDEQRKDEFIMQKTIRIEGMMCGHCAATVKKALLSIDGIQSADVSYEKGTAIVALSKDVEEKVIKKVIEDNDYKVTLIEK